MVSQFATRYCLEQYPGQFEIMVCSSGEEGIELCAGMLGDNGKLPDIIFLDLTMHEMDGWTFIENLELISEGYDHPEIYILSAFSNAKDREVARQHSLVAGYFDKPLNRGNLEKVFQAKHSS